MRAMLMERIVLSNKVEKKAGPITKAGRGVVRSVSGAGDQKIKGADRSRRAFRCLAAPSSCFILGRHGGLACLESLERRRPSPLYRWPRRRRTWLRGRARREAFAHEPGKFAD